MAPVVLVLLVLVVLPVMQANSEVDFDFKKLQMDDELENVKNRKLSPELLEKARVELNEIQSEVPGHIEALRQRILDDPTINFRTDDSFLLRFLRARKFDQDEAFELMTSYHMQRDYYSTLFSTKKSELEKLLDYQAIGVLPNRDANGRAIILYLVDRWNPDEIPVELLMFQFLLTSEILLEDEANQINGVVWIIEMTGFNMSQALQMTPWKMKEAVAVLLNAFPLQLKGIHYLNEPGIFEGVFSMIKFFLSKEHQDRVVFHGDCTASFHEWFSPEILPKELKGDQDPADFTKWNKILLDNFDRVTEGFQKGFV